MRESKISTHDFEFQLIHARRAQFKNLFYNEIVFHSSRISAVYRSANKQTRKDKTIEKILIDIVIKSDGGKKLKIFHVRFLISSTHIGKLYTSKCPYLELTLFSAAILNHILMILSKPSNIRTKRTLY